MIEETVRRTLERGDPGVDPLKLRRLRFDHRRRLDAIYDQADGERREAAFREHFMGVFRELSAASWIPRWLDLFPGLCARLQCVLVRPASKPNEEGAELWESRECRGSGVPAYLVITVSSSGLLDHDRLRDRLLPDLMQAADLIDPDFGFRREDLRGPTPAARERMRVLYRRLWELSARARLHARGLTKEPCLRADVSALAEAMGECAEGAPLVAPDDPDEVGRNDGRTVPAAGVLATLVNGCRHEDLLALTHRLLAGAKTGPSDAGARCPLCHYPTTDWAADEILTALQTTIEIDFPGWAASHGCCGHCAERYELFARRAATTAAR